MTGFACCGTTNIGMLVVSLVSGDVHVLEPDNLQIRRSFNSTQSIEQPVTESPITEELNQGSGDSFLFPNFIDCTAVSRNGKIMVMKDSQTSFNAWNLVTGEHIQHFELTTFQLGEIGPMAVTIDGNQAATAHKSFISRGKSIVVTWDVASGSVIHLFENYYNSPMELEFSPNGSFLICSDNGGEITEFCLSGAKFMTRHVQNGHYFASEMSAVAWEPGSNSFLCGHVDGSVITVGSAGSNWHSSTNPITTNNDEPPLPEPPLPGPRFAFGKPGLAFGLHGDGVNSLAISSDGMRLAVGGARYLDNLETHYRVKHECIEDDETSSWYSGFVAVYDATRMTPRWKNWAGVGAVFSVSFSLDDNFLASGGADGFFRLWDSSKGTIVNKVNLFHQLTNVCFVFDVELQKKRCLAVAMSGHKRLGSESILGVLPEDVLGKLLLLV